MVYLRGLENCLALTRQPSATRTLAPSFQWLVGKCAELHHQCTCALAPFSGSGAFLLSGSAFYNFLWPPLADSEIVACADGRQQFASNLHVRPTRIIHP